MQLIIKPNSFAGLDETSEMGVLFTAGTVDQIYFSVTVMQILDDRKMSILILLFQKLREMIQKANSNLQIFKHMFFGVREHRDCLGSLPEGEG